MVPHDNIMNGTYLCTYTINGITYALFIPRLAARLSLDKVFSIVIYRGLDMNTSEIEVEYVLGFKTFDIAFRNYRRIVSEPIPRGSYRNYDKNCNDSHTYPKYPSSEIKEYYRGITEVDLDLEFPVKEELP